MVSILVIDDEPVIRLLHRTASINMAAPLSMCCYRMEPTSFTRWSKTVGAGGIESMRLVTTCSKG
jgi:hypothetical protein